MDRSEPGVLEMLERIKKMQQPGLAAVRERLPQVFSRLPKAPYEIRRVPPEIEIGAHPPRHEAVNVA